MNKKNGGGAGKPSLYRKSDQFRIVPLQKRFDKDWRGQFRRDYSRLLHCPAFRRLQGKTQLFSGNESDFFRTRLTHSLEVAQVAKSVALKINRSLRRQYDLEIDTDLVEFAGLAHDIGHPPFGHTGEEALNELMQEHGGFEGNAQTLRILTRLEKKLDDASRQMLRDNHGGVEPLWFANGADAAVGLNLCSRTIGSILKYDNMIPQGQTTKPDQDNHDEANAADHGRSPKLPSRKLVKGYYCTEGSVVEKVKADVAPGMDEPLKTIECQIMDIADDIAYSTYDLEDSLKARLAGIHDILHPNKSILAQVTEGVREKLGDPTFSDDDAIAAAGRPLGEVFRLNWSAENQFAASRWLAEDGFNRNALTSSLIRRFVEGVHFKFNPGMPSMSSVYLDRSIWEEIEVLKRFNFVMIVQSNRLKIVASRYQFIINAIMEALTRPGGAELLPNDFRTKYRQACGSEQNLRRDAHEVPNAMRVLCDFVAGMTDRYAVEFFTRLRSETYQTIFRDY